MNVCIIPTGFIDSVSFKFYQYCVPTGIDSLSVITFTNQYPVNSRK